MAKILIADPSEEQCAAYISALGDGHTLKICRDGRTARELLSSFQPDAFILELRLTHVDGLTLLEELDPLFRPTVLVYTGCRTAYVEYRLDNLCDYVMYKPGDMSALVDRLEDMLRVRQNSRVLWDSADPLQAILLELMSHPGRHGYMYLPTAVRLFAADPMQPLTKELYPAVAQQFGTNGKCVEKAIRDAIEQAWQERDNEVWRRYFPTDRSGQVCKPTNKAFLAIVAGHLHCQRRRA